MICGSPFMRTLHPRDAVASHSTTRSLTITRSGPAITAGAARRHDALGRLRARPHGSTDVPLGDAQTETDDHHSTGPCDGTAPPTSVASRDPKNSHPAASRYAA